MNALLKNKALPLTHLNLLQMIRITLLWISIFEVHQPVGAAVFYVDSRHGTPPFVGSVQEPFPTIFSALEIASDGDELRIAVGRYQGNLVIDDKSVALSGGWIGGSEGAYANGGLGGDFEERANGGEWTHLSGNSSQPVILLQGEGASGSTIERMHLSDGSHGIEGNSWPPLTDVLIRGNWIRNNGRPATERGEVDGGGISISGERISILDNVIQENEGGIGGGLFGDILQMEVIGNQFLSNDGHSDHGGGVALSGSGTIKNNLFDGNQIGLGLGYGWGGGMTLFGRFDLLPGEIFHLEGNEYRENFAPTAGGGLYVDDGAVAEISRELIHHNRVDANGNGGAGVYVDGAGTEDDWTPSYATFEFCTIADNSGRNGNSGNGILIEASEVSISNCIFWGNGDDFLFDGLGTFEVRYSLSGENIAGEGNQTSDPLFAD